MTAIDIASDALDGQGEGWTAGEIRQQPRLWRELAGTLAARQARTDGFLHPLLSRPELRVILTGAGTSAFAGELLAPELARRLGRRVDSIATTDLVSNPREYLAEDVPTLLVSFARSGDSPESTAAVRLAEQCLTECHHLVITCNEAGALARAHVEAPRSLVLVMPAGSNDRGFAMTSSFTCMVLAALLSLGNALTPGDALTADEPDVDASGVERLCRAAEQVLHDGPARTKELARRGFHRIVYLGSGPLKGLARESALKTLELTAGRIGTWFESPLGFRHGPKSVIDAGTLVVVFVSDDPYTRRYDLDIAAELRPSTGLGQLVVVTGTPVDDLDAQQLWQLATAGLGDAAGALVYVVCAQLLALSLAVRLGGDPDNPFPSREVNRVVQGVTVHPLGIDR